jgi:hypothetical protein
MDGSQIQVTYCFQIQAKRGPEIKFKIDFTQVRKFQFKGFSKDPFKYNNMLVRQYNPL